MSDLTGPIENAVAKINDDYDASECELYFCRATRVCTISSGTWKDVAEINYKPQRLRTTKAIYEHIQQGRWSTSKLILLRIILGTL